MLDNTQLNALCEELEQAVANQLAVSAHIAELRKAIDIFRANYPLYSFWGPVKHNEFYQVDICNKFHKVLVEVRVPSKRPVP